MSNSDVTPSAMKRERPWTPLAREGETVDDLPLHEVIGQAIGTASMCWANVAGAGEFDSRRAQWVVDGLHAHVQRVIDGVIAGTAKAMSGPGSVLLHRCGWCQLMFETPDQAREHVNATHRQAQLEPALGLASTRELLDELKARGHVGMLAGDANSGDCGRLEEKVGNLLATLRRPVLDYRTVD